MTLLVTGGTGFIMSHVALQWLLAAPGRKAVILDIDPPDRLAEHFLRPVRERLTIVTGNAADVGLVSGLAADHGVTLIVHGAAVTPTIGAGERTAAAMTVETNVMATVAALEAARAAPGFRRFIHVSTSSIYGAGGPAGPLPEDGFEETSPATLYPITKRCGELLARRWAELFGLDLAAVRPASVYGPMDRPTTGRNWRSAAHVIAHKAAAGEPVRVSGAAAVGDWIHAGDVARAITAMLDAATLNHPVYNVGLGEAFTIADVARMAGARLVEADGEDADVVADPSRRRGLHGALDIARLQDDTGWRPRPLEAALGDYVAWITGQDRSRGVPCRRRSGRSGGRSRE